MIYDYLSKPKHHVISSIGWQTGLFGSGSAFVHVATKRCQRQHGDLMFYVICTQGWRHYPYPSRGSRQGVRYMYYMQVSATTYKTYNIFGMNIELFYNFFILFQAMSKLVEAEWQKHSVSMGIPIPRLSASNNRKLAITIHVHLYIEKGKQRRNNRWPLPNTWHIMSELPIGTRTKVTSGRPGTSAWMLSRTPLG